MKRFRHEFVKTIPDRLDYCVLYISIEYGTIMHLCACGCGNEVITPLSPAGWKISYDGESISLNPSIGNWSFECQSHYWIKSGKIVWSYKFSEDEIIKTRNLDEQDQKKRYQEKLFERKDRGHIIANASKSKRFSWIDKLFFWQRRII
jgi:hypothetical protein